MPKSVFMLHVSHPYLVSLSYHSIPYTSFLNSQIFCLLVSTHFIHLCVKGGKPLYKLILKKDPVVVYKHVVVMEMM